MIHIILWDGDRDKPIRYFDLESFNLGNLILDCHVLEYTLDADDVSMTAGGLKVVLHGVVQV